MIFHVGMALKWVPESRWAQNEPVTVVELRKHGKALLSNGWIVDEDGVAEGTQRIPGGRVYSSASASPT